MKAIHKIFISSKFSILILFQLRNTWSDVGVCRYENVSHYYRFVLMFCTTIIATRSTLTKADYKQTLRSIQLLDFLLFCFLCACVSLLYFLFLCPPFRIKGKLTVSSSQNFLFVMKRKTEDRRYLATFAQ
jgi:heme/copper-type cytochrome/quinol oxidase subunit 4